MHFATGGIALARSANEASKFSKARLSAGHWGATMITIAVINESKHIDDTAINEMLPIFAKQWNRDLVPAWRVDPAELVFIARGHSPPDRAWWLVWLDDADQADALAYHDLTDEGQPISKVFVQTIRADHASESVAATHELCEMAVDPTINLAAQDPQSAFWAYEVADPVESDNYGYEIDGLRLTDFVLPSWYGFEHAARPFDFCRHCTDAFQILPGGYAQRYASHGWQQITTREASKPKILTPPPGSRRDRRHRGRGRWRRSERRTDR